MTPVKTQIANLIQLAKADGVLSPEEIMLVFGIAQKHGVTKYDLDHIIENASDWSTAPPTAKNDRVVYFYQLLIMATVDGEVSDVEAAMLRKVGGELGLNSQNINQAIAHIEENTETDLSEVEMRAILSAGLN